MLAVTFHVRIIKTSIHDSDCERERENVLAIKIVIAQAASERERKMLRNWSRFLINIFI